MFKAITSTIGFLLLSIFTYGQCAVNDLTIDFSDCNGDGNYNATINFNAQNPGNEFFDLFINQEFFAFYALADLPVTIENYPHGGLSGGMINVCINDNPDCCAFVQYQTPDCPSNCEIFNVFAEAHECDDEGNFLVDFEFDIEGQGSEGFTVFGNGMNYGDFEYGQTFYTVGPFEGNGNSIYEIIIQDIENPDCQNFIAIEANDCNPVGDCVISEIFANVICEGEEIFFVELNFEFLNTGNEGFTVAGNGANYGNFEYGELPIFLGPFESGLDINWEFVVIDNEADDCQNFVEVGEVDCTNGEDCQITNTFIEYQPCNGDGNFFIHVGVEVENPVSSTFNIVGNGQNYGNFPYGQGFYEIGPFSGNGANFELIFIDGDDETCQTEVVFEGIICGGDCVVTDFVLEPTDCDDEGNYDLIVNFNVQNGDNNFFELTYGDEFIGFYELSALPLTLENFQDNGEFSPLLTVCLNDAPECCTNSEFVAPNCDSGECAVNDLTIDFSDCNGDGNYNATINFNAQNSGNEFFDLFINQEFYAFYALDDLPITIENFPDGGMSGGLINVCINDNPDCCAFLQFGTPDCETPECEIFNISTEIPVCDDEGNFLVHFEFDIEGQGSEGFTVFGNGMEYGNFEYGESSYTVGPFEGNGNSIYEIIIQDLENPDCQNFIAVEAINCNPVDDCNISEIFANVICEGEEIFFVELNFEFENTGNEGFTVAGNGANYGNFEYGDLPIFLGPFESGLDINWEFVVIDNEVDDCQNFVEIGEVDCANDEDCQITNTFIEYQPCNGDGNFFIHVGVEVENPVSSTFNIVGNGQNYGNFPYGQGFYEIGPFPGNGANFELIFIDEDDETCQTEVVFEGIICGGDCFITDFGVEPTECDDDGNYNLIVNFNTQNPNNEFFDLFINQEYFNSYSLDELPLTIEDFPNGGLSGHLVSVCVNDNPDCCAFAQFESPDCETPDCEIFNISTEIPVCDDEGNFLVHFEFDIEGQGSEGFTVFGNGMEYGNFEYGQPFYTVGPFEGNGNSIYEIIIQDLENPDCQNFIVIEAIDCNAPNLVWPGDANNDNIANNLDVLNLGIAFNATGPGRDLLGIEWSPMAAENWDMVFETGVNFVHADTDGNGEVNAEDLTGIDINYGLTHGDFEFEYNEVGTENDPALFVDLPNPDLITIGEPFTAPINLGTADIPVENIYGLAFTLVFDETIIDPASIEIDYNSSWLGQNGTNLLTLDKTIVGEGELDIVLTKTDLNNVSGFGQIAAFIGIIDNIAGKSEVQIEVKDIHAIGNDEIVVPLQRPVEMIEITVSTNNQHVNNEVSIYPNPVTDELIIANRLHLPMTSCEIRNADGKLVKTVLDGQKKLDVSHLTSGVYLLKFEIDGQMFFERFVKL